MADEPAGKESKVEGIKRDSHHLRGTLAEELTQDSSHFAKDTTNLLKFHGVYQQDDRDQRHENRKKGLEEAWQFMVRCAIPGGVLTAEQYLALDALADRYANGTLRVTTRQGIQYHGVIKRRLKQTIKKINDALVTTLSACGDVERNVMACPAPLADEAHVAARKAAREIAVQLRPASGAYHEIWLDGEKTHSTLEEEPFYGEQYLPRKFKTAIALSGDNCVDVYNHDLGLVAIGDGARIRGYNILVGGGMGMTHGKSDTIAMLGKPLGFVAAEHVIEAARTVVAIFRDFGNRADRRHARIKYLVHERGMDWVREEFNRRALFPLEPFREMPRFEFHDHLGKERQEDGKYFFGMFIQNGRIKDNGVGAMKTTLREVVEAFRPGVVLTPNQNLLFTGLTSDAVDEIGRKLKERGVIPPSDLSAARRFSMACPALPTCGLAMAESERAMPGVVDEFEAELVSLGLRDVPIGLRMTGCPNGCARPYTADISFVGRRPGIYHVYVGGGLRGDRVADLYAGDVKQEELVATLRPLLSSWATHRGADESLSDYYQKLVGHASPRPYITGDEESTQALVQLKITP